MVFVGFQDENEGFPALGFRPAQSMRSDHSSIRTY